MWNLVKFDFFCKHFAWIYFCGSKSLENSRRQILTNRRKFCKIRETLSARKLIWRKLFSAKINHVKVWQHVECRTWKWFFVLFIWLFKNCSEKMYFIFINSIVLRVTGSKKVIQQACRNYSNLSFWCDSAGCNFVVIFLIWISANFFINFCNLLLVHEG